jgi:hypothetical protein
MWQVVNQTPFAASGVWTRDRDGAEVWLVAVRCSFRINPDGTTVVADEQEAPIMAPKFTGEPAISSLRYDSDFYLTKPTTDVLLHGRAYAPGGKPAEQVDVTWRVGEVRKTLRVSGDRLYQAGIMGSLPKRIEPFAAMPLTYERTYGGAEPNPPKKENRPQFDDRNPVGTGFSPIAGKTAPNVEYPGINSGAKPAGFGPSPSNWRPRVRYAGTYDEVWQKDRCPLYPHDLDDRFFLCSPEDQRPKEYLRGGEPVELLNLTPSGRMAFSLPRVALGFETIFRGGDRVSHQGKLHSVILEPDVPRVVLVWRTELPCHPRVLKLQRTVIREKRILNSPNLGFLAATGN